MYINGKKFSPQKYSSGEMKLSRNILDSYIANNEVTILYLNEESIFELFIIIDYYKNKIVTNNNLETKLKVNLIMSYLPYQRMDHKNTNELNTVQNVANIINSFNLDSLTICEPHCNIEEFTNSKTFSLINNIKNKVFKNINFNKDIDTIVLTDHGGLSKFKNLAPNVVYFNKKRDPKTGLIIKHEIVGTIKPNSKCLIVDDIISTGDTVFNIVEHLAKLRIKNIYILCGHLESNKYNKRLVKHRLVKHIFSTNSLNKKQVKKITLYDIFDIFYDTKQN